MYDRKMCFSTPSFIIKKYNNIPFTEIEIKFFRRGSKNCASLYRNLRIQQTMTEVHARRRPALMELP